MKNPFNLNTNVFDVAPLVWGQKDVFVNFYIVQSKDSNDWFLVDAGLKWSAKKIKEMAAGLFGKERAPKAIVLTHGHFDHIGSVETLANEWNVPVYVHQLEVPYLTGQSSYPPPDPTVGGGLMSSMAFLYPYSPINIWKRIKILPADGEIPGFPEWKYIHTPGHSPGHISLFRNDGVLIAGDAFVTTKAESGISTMLQLKKVSGPPKYFTCDWQAAKTSVEKLLQLSPRIAATGHGKVMQGKELTEELNKLSTFFYKKALPAHGRYIPYPAITDSKGVVYLPPVKNGTHNHAALKAFGFAAAFTGVLVWQHLRNKKRIENETLIDVEYNY